MLTPTTRHRIWTVLQLAGALALTAVLTYLVAAALVAWTIPASRYGR